MTAEAVVLSQIQRTSMLVPQSAANTAAATTAGVDLTGYEGVVEVTVHYGALVGTAALRIEDSADNSTFGDPANAANFQMTAAGVAATYSKDVAAAASTVYSILIDTRAVKRYIRFLGTLSAAALVSVSIGGMKKYRP